MNERIKELKHQAFLWCDENNRTLDRVFDPAV